jgi:type VI secretion system secreted protein VgrG
MPSPKSGKAGSAVAPTEPAEPEEADVADPGKVEKIKADQKEAKAGKYGVVSMKPFKAADKKGKDSSKEEKTAWIEVELVDEDGQPVPGERFRITLPDDSVAEGTLDDKGKARVEGFKPGNCKVTFPGLDKDAWEPA